MTDQIRQNIEKTKGIIRGKVTAEELHRALICAEWSNQFAGKLSKEIAELLVKFANDICWLNQEIQKDMNYRAARDYSDYIRDSQPVYDCGEL